uniref:ZFAND2A/B-like C2H2 zinc finger domain-containing protein n=1 Tax=Timema poppense TaxID=170557 RepID=A0A7R9CJY0_TIMPO|nr:unnamed protein product [Timema poppensis]
MVTGLPSEQGLVVPNFSLHVFDYVAPLKGKEHMVYSCHNCPSACQKDVQVPLCPLCNAPVLVGPGEQPDKVVGEHIEQDCQAISAIDRRKIIGDGCGKNLFTDISSILYSADSCLPQVFHPKITSNETILLKTSNLPYQDKGQNNVCIPGEKNETSVDLDRIKKKPSYIKGDTSKPTDVVPTLRIKRGKILLNKIKKRRKRKKTLKNKRRLNTHQCSNPSLSVSASSSSQLGLSTPQNDSASCVLQDNLKQAHLSSPVEVSTAPNLQEHTKFHSDSRLIVQDILETAIKSMLDNVTEASSCDTNAVPVQQNSKMCSTNVCSPQNIEENVKSQQPVPEVVSEVGSEAVPNCSLGSLELPDNVKSKKDSGKSNNITKENETDSSFLGAAVANKVCESRVTNIATMNVKRTDIVNGPLVIKVCADSSSVMINVSSTDADLSCEVASSNLAQGSSVVLDSCQELTTSRILMGSNIADSSCTTTPFIVHKNPKNTIKEVEESSHGQIKQRSKSINCIEGEPKYKLEVESSLPLKKRLKCLTHVVETNVKTDSLKSSISESLPSYPATPMISIAELELSKTLFTNNVEALPERTDFSRDMCALKSVHEALALPTIEGHKMFQERRLFKTPAELKQIPVSEKESSISFLLKTEPSSTPIDSNQPSKLSDPGKHESVEADAKQVLDLRVLKDNGTVFHLQRTFSNTLSITIASPIWFFSSHMSQEKFVLINFINSRVDWDDKLLPNVASHDRIELPIILVSGLSGYQLLFVPQLTYRTEEKQAAAVSTFNQCISDHREFLELSTVFLGGTQCRGVCFRAPEAFHHVQDGCLMRFML